MTSLMRMVPEGFLADIQFLFNGISAVMTIQFDYLPVLWTFSTNGLPDTGAFRVRRNARRRLSDQTRICYMKIYKNC